MVNVSISLRGNVNLVNFGVQAASLSSQHFRGHVLTACQGWVKGKVCASIYVCVCVCVLAFTILLRHFFLSVHFLLFEHTQIGPCDLDSTAVINYSTEPLWHTTPALWQSRLTAVGACKSRRNKQVVRFKNSQNILLSPTIITCLVIDSLWSKWKNLKRHRRP